VGPYAFFRGEIVPFEQAKVSIATHALNYGTGCFEGIRANWNPRQEQLYVFRLREHYERLQRSARILHMRLGYSVAELCEITLELLRRNGHREDTYIRPLAYKGSEALGVRLHQLEDHFAIFTMPFGSYFESEGGARCCVVSWRRVDDTMIPGRAKVTGIYVNSALAKTEAQLNGFDEGILLTSAGFVSEGSGENLFLVSGGKLVTPAESESILVGITRNTVIQLAREAFGIETVERPIARNELYTAEELFMTGTAAHVTPIVEVDRRPVGDGEIGPITRKLMDLYFQTIRGDDDRHPEWRTPVY
jgi:branched-chain amino acid aminotransferase